MGILKFRELGTGNGMGKQYIPNRAYGASAKLRILVFLMLIFFLAFLLLDGFWILKEIPLVVESC